MLGFASLTANLRCGHCERSNAISWQAASRVCREIASSPSVSSRWQYFVIHGSAALFWINIGFSSSQPA